MTTFKELRLGNSVWLPKEADREKVEKRLLQLYKRKRWTAKAVLEDGRNPSSALHPVFFNLDDAAAAEEYRLNIARRLLGAVEITVERVNQAPVVVRAFQHFPDPAMGKSREGEYISLEETLSDEGLRQRQLEAAIRGFEAFKRHWGYLEELQPVFDAFDKLTKRLKLPVAAE